VEYFGDKIHSRHGYEWRHPVHEVLYRLSGQTPELQSWSDLVIEHFPDRTKSRSQYLSLLELAVEEDPDNDRNSHYLGREYYYTKDFVKAKKELKRHLLLPKACWDAERAASMRYLAHCCMFLGQSEEQLAWLMRACAEAPGEREPWIDLSQYYFDHKEYLGGYFAAKQALKITTRPPTYMTNGFAWGERAYDLAGTCASYVGLLEESRDARDGSSCPHACNDNVDLAIGVFPDFGAGGFFISIKAAGNTRKVITSETQMPADIIQPKVATGTRSLKIRDSNPTTVVNAP
jgi:tetratricopeptide (TPR) repeat protein